MKVPSYRLYGVTFSSSFPFTFSLMPGNGPADFRFEEDLGAADDFPSESAAVVYQSPFSGADGQPILQVLQKSPSCHLMHFPGVADFVLDEHSIAFRPAAPLRRDLIEIRFLGTVLSFFLERMGLPVLHASVIGAQGEAVAFLGSNGGGKTSLAASFIQDGFALLSDDLAPLEFFESRVTVHPGYPQMRVWPDLASHLMGSLEGLPRVLEAGEKLRLPIGGPNGFGEFCGESWPLRAIYLPQRDDSLASNGIRVETLGLRDAVVELVRSSFLARVVDALGWQPRRIEFLARLGARLPLRRLHYPSGFDRLGHVRDFVLEDLAREQ